MERISQESKFICTIKFLLFFSIILFTADLYALNVSFLVGNVAIYRNGKQIKPEINKSVISGDIVKTEKGGMIVLDYCDGSQIRVQENSKIKIGSSGVKDSDSVSVIAGIVNGNFKKILKGKDRKVYTPTTVCSVRGTEFSVCASNGTDSRVELKKGKLDIRNPYGKIELNNNENADVSTAESPVKKDDKSGTLEEWKSGKDKDFDKDPSGKAGKIKGYLQNFKDRSSGASKDINSMENKFKEGGMKKKSDMEKAGDDINKVENEVEEDMMLNEAANSSIDGILNRFQKDKDDIYNIFYKIKEESNRVLEQQRRNYESIRAVKEAYKKAYEEIMGKHKNYMDQIKDKFHKDDYKPK